MPFGILNFERVFFNLNSNHFNFKKHFVTDKYKSINPFNEQGNYLLDLMKKNSKMKKGSLLKNVLYNTHLNDTKTSEINDKTFNDKFICIELN